MARTSGLYAGAVLAFVLADGAAAHPRPTNAIDSTRLIGAVEQTGEEPYAQGKRLLAADDVMGALAAFRAALVATPQSVDALNGIGVSYDRLGRPDLARSYYQAGLAIDPTAPALLNNLGYSLFLSGDTAAAVTPLRAAAASGDPEAAGAASATLARLVTGVDRDRTAATSAPGPVARIEVTSEGEQRLTTTPAPAAAASLGDDAAAVIVATLWSDADDAALLARVHADEAAEVALAAAAQPESSPVSPAPVATAADPPPTPRASPQPRASRADAASALVLTSATADAAPARRLRMTNAPAAIALHDGPRPRTAVAFDSDDEELNAFAARVNARGTEAMVSAVGERGRIAARFRA